MQAGKGSALSLLSISTNPKREIWIANYMELIVIWWLDRPFLPIFNDDNEAQKISSLGSYKIEPCDGAEFEGE